jgi:hypothetical protein
MDHNSANDGMLVMLNMLATLFAPREQQNLLGNGRITTRPMNWQPQDRAIIASNRSLFEKERNNQKERRWQMEASYKRRVERARQHELRTGTRRS